MGDKIKFSIVVPVYNVEEYLSECVESLIRQTYEAYEIILVDDGSTDRSGSICDTYAKQNQNIKVYHKKNGGLSDARNYGVEYATGDYMIFVDSDDYIDLNTLQIYYKNCIRNDNPDILIDQSNYTFYGDKVESDNYYNYLTFGRKTGKEAFKELASGGPLWSPCSKCYKIDFWKRNNFQFRKGIYAEDLDLIYKVIYLADVVVMTPRTYYYRGKRKGSITNTIKKKQFMDIFDIVDRWETFFDNYNIDKQDCKNMYFYFGEIIVYFILGNMFLLDKGERKEIYCRLKNYIHVCQEYDTILGKMTYIVIKIAGVKVASFLVFYAKHICMKVMRR